MMEQLDDGQPMPRPLMGIDLGIVSRHAVRAQACDRLPKDAIRHKMRIRDLVRQLLPMTLLAGDLGTTDLAVLECYADSSPGNTQGDLQRFGQLIDDLEEWVFGPLPDGTWVYPGHDHDTRPGAERPHLPEWRARGW